jgi:FtsZ-binding cell division protein ZapB
VKGNQHQLLQQYITTMFTITIDHLIMLAGGVVALVATGMIHILTNDIADKFIAKVTQLKTNNITLVSEIEELRRQNVGLAEKLQVAIENSYASEERALALLAKFDELTNQPPQVVNSPDNDLFRENTWLQVRCETLERELEQLRVKPSRLVRYNANYQGLSDPTINSDGDSNDK